MLIKSVQTTSQKALKARHIPAWADRPELVCKDQGLADILRFTSYAIRASRVGNS